MKNVEFLIHFGFMNELLTLSINTCPLPYLISTPDLLYKIDSLYLRIYDFECGIRLYNPSHETTKTILERRKIAKDLADLGFNVKLCEKALELKKGNRDDAIDWLTSEDAVLHVANGGIDGNINVETPRVKEIREIMKTVGLPFHLCENAYKLMNYDKDKTITLLFDKGYIYSEGISEDAFLSAENYYTGTSIYIVLYCIVFFKIYYYCLLYYIIIADSSDQAVLDDIYIEEHKVELIEDTEDTVVDNIHTSNLFECRIIKATSDVEAHALDSWTCELCSYINSKRYTKCQICNNVNTNNVTKTLNNNKYVLLKAGMLVTFNHNYGDMNILYGKTGIYLKQDENISSVLLLDTESGTRKIEKFETRFLNIHEKWSGYRIASTEELYGVLSQYLYSSFLHLCRILLICLLSVWDDTLQNETLSLRHISDDGRNVVQYLQLLMSTENLFMANKKKNATTGRLFLMVNRVMKNIMKLTLLNETNSSILDVYIYISIVIVCLVIC